MVEVTKEEKEIINRALPNACIVRTMKQRSGRHHYYCEESEKAMKLLRSIRAEHMEGRDTDGCGNKTGRNTAPTS